MRVLHKNKFFYFAVLSGIVSSLFLYPVILRAKGTVDFTLKSVEDGTTFKMSEHRGKIILLAFGSIYCKPCIELIPDLNKLYESNKFSNVLIAGVDIDRTSKKEVIKKFASDKNIKFPFFIDTENAVKQCKIFVLPTLILVDGDGMEVKRFVGGQTYNVLEKEIKNQAMKAGGKPCR